MPHVVVKLVTGKSEQKKARLAEAIVKSVMDILQYDEDAISVAMEEVEPEEWAEKVYRPDIVGHAAQLYKKPGYTM